MVRSRCACYPSKIPLLLLNTDSSFLSWNRLAVPEALHSALVVLGDHYPVVEAQGEGNLEFIQNQDRALLQCERMRGGFRIEYGSTALALRGLGLALSRRSVTERAAFGKFGIMLDCSRNAVMKVSYIKRWLNQLALMGYNQLMLYTEDTYQLPGEPCFGYMRGGYSAEEVREVDAYAASLGIEVIACIQTLGHLNQLLKWAPYGNVSDTAGVLLVDAEPTYQLITKMVRFWQENLRSRRVHIGMDEAHDMGRGRFLDQNGWQSPFEVFTRHLRRVASICEQQGLKPMIWSDMYFRMGNSKMDYYDPETVIPEEVRRQVPRNVDMVYWDYYSKDVGFYREWIRRHRDLGGEPIMASGLWTWLRFWYDHKTTKAAVEPCIQACREEGLQEFFFTMWADGGGYCEFDSALAGLAWGADLAHGGSGNDDDVSPMVRGICGSDYHWLLKGGSLQVDLGEEMPSVSPATILWDDLLMGIGRHSYPLEVWPAVLEKLEALRAEFETMPPQSDAVDWEYLKVLIQFMIAKLAFHRTFEEAYRIGDRATLRKLADEMVPELQQLMENFGSNFRRQWLRRNKPFGMEGFQIRIGAMKERSAEAARRIHEYLDGTICRIEEVDARRSDLNAEPLMYFYWLATGSVVI
jgi:hexosaminidase